MITDAVEQVTGHRYTRTSRGTADELRARISEARGRGEGLMSWIGDVYWLFMITGATTVRDPQNHRYPEITPEPLGDIVRRIVPGADEK